MQGRIAKSRTLKERAVNAINRRFPGGQLDELGLRYTNNAKERNGGNFVYSFSAERKVTSEHPADVHSEVSDNAADARSNNSIFKTGEKSQVSDEKSPRESPADRHTKERTDLNTSLRGQPD